MAKLDGLLRGLKERGGSDLHLVAGSAPRMRLSGKLRATEGWPVLTDEQLRDLLREVTTASQWKEYETTRDIDFAYGLEGIARFRANYFNQHHGAGAVFRTIPEKVLTLEELSLPAAVGKFAHLNAGLVLVTGPTGSGKSTTLAAIIDKINETYDKHIVTIEDPIEFVHRNRKSVVSQREVGTHTEDFAGALRGAIRQNPDVVLVGEMRDRETIALALTAAEMGVLVFGTLHTNSAPKTIDRLIDAFASEEQDQVRLTLSESLAGVVAQLLLPAADGTGRCAVNEILIGTAGLRNAIREGNVPMILSIMQNGRQLGMQTMDDALEALVRQGRVTAQEALLKATEKPRFEAMIAKVADGQPNPSLGEF